MKYSNSFIKQLILLIFVVYCLTFVYISHVTTFAFPSPEGQQIQVKGAKMKVLPVRKLFLFLGDSITQQSYGNLDDADLTPAWGSLTAAHFQAKIDIVNRGRSGYNTKIYLPLLPHILDVHLGKDALDRVSLVSILFGANDSVLEEFMQHVPLKEFKTNLEKIINLVRSKAKYANIVLITPPPVGKHGKFGTEGSDGRRRFEVTQASADAVIEVAKRFKTELIDIFYAMVGNPSSPNTYDDYLRDGLHLSAKGNVLVYKMLLQVIENCMPDINEEIYDMLPWNEAYANA